ncbi:protein of unknown function (plasmid) [Pararobbsia alpina]|uniref:hypothetical protein n=1 Tax=Pararobbsia alpina TaxID=621374 RepID=UPI0039A5B5A4
MPLPIAPSSPAPTQDIVVELHPGATTVTLRWPVSAAKDCGQWLQGWLRSNDASERRRSAPTLYLDRAAQCFAVSPYARDCKRLDASIAKIVAADLMG